MTRGQIDLLACIGIAVVSLGAAMAVVEAIDVMRRKILTIFYRRQLRDLECGTCDGLSAAVIAELIDEAWILDEVAED